MLNNGICFIEIKNYKMSDKIKGWNLAEHPPKNNDMILVISYKTDRRSDPFFIMTTTHYNGMINEFVGNMKTVFKSSTVVLWRSMPPMPDNKILESLIKK